MLVVQRFDDDAGCQEQQGLEERVRHEVEDGGAPCANAQRQKHVTDLADRGIREDALDVVLRQRAEACHQKRGGADRGDRELDRRRQLKEDMRACDQVNARRHHGGRMNQGAGRCGTGHRVRQPGLQRQLRRFAHRPSQQ